MTRRRAKGEERERAVVAAAAELMSEQGLVDLRMTDVAERAGMSVGHVTYYFPSKSELLVRAITQSEQEFQARVDSLLSERTDPWDRLCTLVELAAASGPRDRQWLLWLEVWARAGVDEGVAQVQRDLDRWWRDAMRDLVTEGVLSGRFRCEDVEATVSILSALTDGLSVRLTLEDGSISRSEVLDLAVGAARQLLRVSE